MFVHILIVNNSVLTVLPDMMTFEAPIALATSKQTNPIGPGSTQHQTMNDKYWNKYWKTVGLRITFSWLIHASRCTIPAVNVVGW